MRIEKYDEVILKDGRSAAIVEKFSDCDFLADVGDGPHDWETIPIMRDDIVALLPKD